MEFLVTKYQFENSFELDRGFTDLLKFLSCILIALHHYSQYAIGCGGLYNHLYYLFAWQGGYIGVAIFFFLVRLWSNEKRESISSLSEGLYIPKNIQGVFTCFSREFIMASDIFAFRI